MRVEILEIVLTPTILGFPRLKSFQPNGKSSPGYSREKEWRSMIVFPLPRYM